MIYAFAFTKTVFFPLDRFHPPLPRLLFVVLPGCQGKKYSVSFFRRNNNTEHTFCSTCGRGHRQERDVMALWLHYINGLVRMNTKTGPLNFIACRIRVRGIRTVKLRFMNTIAIVDNADIYYCMRNKRCNSFLIKFYILYACTWRVLHFNKT